MSAPRPRLSPPGASSRRGHLNGRKVIQQNTSAVDVIKPAEVPEGVAALSVFFKNLSSSAGDATFYLRGSPLNYGAVNRIAEYEESFTLSAGSERRVRVPVKHAWVWVQCQAASAGTTVQAELHFSSKAHLHVADHANEESDEVLVHGLNGSGDPTALTVDGSGNLNINVSAGSLSVDIDGEATHDAAAPSGLVVGGGVYNSSNPTLDDGDAGQFQVTSEGKLLVADTTAQASLTAISAAVATETTLGNIDGKITTCDTGSVTVAASALPAGAATETTLGSVDTTLTNVTGSDSSTAPSNAVQVLGVHSAGSFPTLTSGQGGVPQLTSEGVLIAAPRCIDGTLGDSINNTQKFERDCSGSSYVGKASFNLVFDEVDGNWHRLRGTPETGLSTSDVLRIKRKAGKCYAASTSDTVSTGGYQALTLFNTSGSGVTLYVYNVDFRIVTDTVASDTDFDARLLPITAYTGGTSITPRNVKLDGGAANAIVTKNTTSVTTSGSELCYIGAFTPGTTYSTAATKDGDFQEEWIEVPEGYGLTVRTGNAGSGEKYNISAELRWFEE